MGHRIVARTAPGQGSTTMPRRHRIPYSDRPRGDRSLPVRTLRRREAILRDVYIPDHFRPSDEDVAELLANIRAAELVTATADGLLATMLPLLHEPAGASPEAGDHGRLMGHVARNNRQWKVPAI